MTQLPTSPRGPRIHVIVKHPRSRRSRVTCEDWTNHEPCQCAVPHEGDCPATLNTPNGTLLEEIEITPPDTPITDHGGIEGRDGANTSAELSRHESPESSTSHGSRSTQSVNVTPTPELRSGPTPASTSSLHEADGIRVYDSSNEGIRVYDSSTSGIRVQGITTDTRHNGEGGHQCPEANSDKGKRVESPSRTDQNATLVASRSEVNATQPQRVDQDQGEGSQQSIEEAEGFDEQLQQQILESESEERRRQVEGQSENERTGQPIGTRSAHSSGYHSSSSVATLPRSIATDVQELVDACEANQRAWCIHQQTWVPQQQAWAEQLVQQLEWAAQEQARAAEQQAHQLEWAAEQRAHAAQQRAQQLEWAAQQRAHAAHQRAQQLEQAAQQRAQAAQQQAQQQALAVQQRMWAAQQQAQAVQQRVWAAHQRGLAAQQRAHAAQQRAWARGF